MTSLNTIEVGSNFNSSTPAADVGRSEQHGLMGPSMAGINNDDFDDGAKVHNRNMAVSEAIEDQDDGKKKGSGAMKKGKKKRKQGRKGTDADMLYVHQAEGENSWDSSRGHA